MSEPAALRNPGLVDPEPRQHQAVLVVGFGGPEGPDEVVPFLERVTAGRGVPRERLVEVGAHYDLFGGISPINAQTRSVVALLQDELDRRGLDLPVHWGNRNAAPFVADAVADLIEAGVTEAVFVPTSSFPSYSGCRQYREDVAAACSEAAERTGRDAPRFDRLRQHGDHPGFVEPMADRVRTALAGVPEERRDRARFAFTAHSIPTAMADTCDYELRLRESASLVMERAGLGDREWELVWQSRSGPPQVPWLEPDILDHLDDLAEDGATDVVIVPIGFVSDHVEVVYDLDVEAAAHAATLGMHLVRAGTVGTDPRFIGMLADLVEERRAGGTERRNLGELPAPHDQCLATCCPNLRRPDTPALGQVDPG